MQQTIGPRRKTLAKVGREGLQTALLVVLMFLGVRVVLQNFRVEGPSMQPTLTTGEAYAALSSPAFHTTLPVSLWNATVLAPLAPGSA